MAPNPAHSIPRSVIRPLNPRITRDLLGILALGGILAGASLYLQIGPEVSPEMAVAQQGPLIHEIYATGMLNARATVNVGSQLSGVVERIAVDHDQRVRRGQVLALLDVDRREAELAQAEAALESATALLERASVHLQEADLSLQRTRRLFAAGLVAASECDGADARYRSAKAEASAYERQVAQGEATVRLARVDLARAAIRSPMDGVVLSRNIEAGETVTASSSTLFIIGTDLRELQLDIDVSEADVGHLAVGQPVTFTVEAYPGRVFTGVVKETRVGAHFKQQAVYYRGIAAVPNAVLQLRSGMTADVWIQTARHEHALLVPPTAIREEDGTRYVDVVDGRTVRRRAITTGLTGKDGLVEVLSGLAPGEQIVTAAK